ncbi:AurF N-oxygenase family protein [Saccharopolyspora dendranthemae]|uniref:Para-aminobenzoate N-oxygenase AurF n=1 Tax=Saccharopolyspora dendranthemae TaxID=1181886 RepID=A0A561U3P6_9PSEU|nr:diiron oxygenase [Saccharopolyspora dendranthemae]TWF93967.1 para-aminobenzoate N-oxygenase AurF [Saccharopolyspora dendranthemae]
MTAVGVAGQSAEQDFSSRLLESSQTLSYDPITEIDWDGPLPEDQYGLSPEWSTLYGTPLWDELTEQQRVTLTRHEVCSMMSTGIWFEMILQQMILRDQYVKNPANSEFQFALTEIADECRHSIMFARICQKLEVPAYLPSKLVVELARGFKTLATGEVAYGGTLVAEEVLDVVQRDFMRDDRVLDVVQTSSKIHVVEESRHMKFAREEIKEHVQGKSKLQRHFSAALIAVVAYVIVSSLVSPKVYDSIGMDRKRAAAAVRDNEHRKSLMRNGCAGLMEFLDEAGLLTRPAIALYKRVHMI